MSRPRLRLLHHDPAHPWTVAELADATSLSRASLARRFNELVGEPPMTFLTGWRIALAADLLREPGATIGAVASQVGYGSPFALSTAFKRSAASARSSTVPTPSGADTWRQRRAIPKPVAQPTPNRIGHAQRHQPGRTSAVTARTSRSDLRSPAPFRPYNDPSGAYRRDDYTLRSVSTVDAQARWRRELPRRRARPSGNLGGVAT